MNRHAEFGSVRRQRRAWLGLAGWLVVLGMAACGGQEREKAAPDAGALDGDAGSLEIAADAASDAADGGADSGPAQVAPWLESRPWKSPIAATCPPLPTSDDRYAELLAALGLDRDVGIGKAIYERAGGFLAGDPQRLPHFHEVQADIDGLGLCWANQVVAELDGAVASDHPMTSLLATAASSLGVQIDVGGPFVLMDPAQPLVAALRAVHIVAGGDFDEAQVAAAAATVPMAVQRVAARVLLGALAAVEGREAFLAKSGNSARYGAWFQYGSGLWVPVKGGAVDPGAAADAKVFELDVGYRDLFGGAGRLLQAIDEADLTSARSDAVFAFSTTTPWGRVAIRGGGNDTWDDLDPALEGDILLALDTGGDDTWFIRAGANTSVQNPVAVAIDLGGKDTYTYREKTDVAVAPGRLPPDQDGVAKTPGRDWLFPQSTSNQNRQGSGRLGYGVLVDLGGGADVYRSPRMSQGHALFGVGVLWDDGGADHYIGERAVQGQTATRARPLCRARATGLAPGSSPTPAAPTPTTASSTPRAQRRTSASASCSKAAASTPPAATARCTYARPRTRAAAARHALRL